MSPRSLTAFALAAVLLAPGCSTEPQVPVRAPLVRGDAAALAEVTAALEHLAGGRKAQALTALEASLEAHPSSHEAHLEYARLAATSGLTAPALAIYERLFDEDPTDDAVARGLARLALFLGRTDLASGAATALASAGAGSGDLALAAEVARTTGDLDLALARAEAAVDADPKDPDAHHQVALALLELGADDPEATGPIQAALRRAIHNDPGRTEARHLLGTLLLQAGEEKRGAEQLSALERIQELGAPAFAEADPATRIQQARAVGRELPEWSRPQLEIARAQLALGRAVKAEETLVEAMQLKPRTLELYKLRYAAAIARGDEKARKNWLERWNTKRGQDG